MPQPVPEAPPAEQAPPEPVRQPETVTLTEGTSITVRLAETISTDSNYSVRSIRATLDTPIIVNGMVIADHGSTVYGKIVNAEKAGRVQGVSNLTLALTELNTTDGQRVRISTSPWEKQGQTSHAEDAAKIGGGAALGAIIGGLAGGGKGAAIGAGAGGAAGHGSGAWNAR